MTAQTAAHDDHGEGHDDHVHHHNYVRIWAILVVLLVISVAGPELDIQIVTLITAFGIAVVKAYMVAKYFMHIDVQSPVVHYFVVTALVFMVLFFAGTSPDVLKHEGQGWENLAAKAETARALEAAAQGGDHHGEPEAHPAPEPGHH